MYVQSFCKAWECAFVYWCLRFKIENVCIMVWECVYHGLRMCVSWFENVCIMVWECVYPRWFENVCIMVWECVYPRWFENVCIRDGLRMCASWFENVCIMVWECVYHGLRMCVSWLENVCIMVCIDFSGRVSYLVHAHANFSTPTRNHCHIWQHSQTMSL
jgi:hypothetical protein